MISKKSQLYPSWRYESLSNPVVQEQRGLGTVTMTAGDCPGNTLPSLTLTNRTAHHQVIKPILLFCIFSLFEWLPKRLMRVEICKFDTNHESTCLWSLNTINCTNGIGHKEVLGGYATIINVRDFPNFRFRHMAFLNILY